MANFCMKCGSKLQEGDQFCTNCGMPVAKMEIPGNQNQAAQRQVMQGQAIQGQVMPRQMRAVQKPSGKKTGLIIGAIAGGTALVVLILVIMVFLFSGGKEKVSNQVMEAYQSEDIDTLMDLSSDLMEYAGMTSTFKKYVEGAIEDDLHSFEKQLGDDYKLSYEIINIEELSKMEQEEYTESVLMYIAMKGIPNVDENFVSEMCSVEVEWTAKTDDDFVTIEKTIILSKEDGTWRMFDIQ